MNKILLAVIIFGLSFASAQPVVQRQCAVNEEIALKLAELVDRVAKGEGKLWVKNNKCCKFCVKY